MTKEGQEEQEESEECKILFVVYMGEVCPYLETYMLSENEPRTDNVVLFQIEGSLNINDERGTRAFVEEMFKKLKHKARNMGFVYVANLDD